MMRLSFILGLLETCVFAQGAFEPPNLDVAKALSEKGVDVSSIPELSNLVKHSSTSACSIAVCVLNFAAFDFDVDTWTVQFAQQDIR
jgi:hypothetical protein